MLVCQPTTISMARVGIRVYPPPRVNRMAHTRPELDKNAWVSSSGHAGFFKILYHVKNQTYVPLCLESLGIKIHMPGVECFEISEIIQPYSWPAKCPGFFCGVNVSSPLIAVEFFVPLLL